MCLDKNCNCEADETIPILTLDGAISRNDPAKQWFTHLYEMISKGIILEVERCRLDETSYERADEEPVVEAKNTYSIRRAKSSHGNHHALAGNELMKKIKK